MRKTILITFILLTKFSLCVNSIFAQEIKDSTSTTNFNQIIFSDEFEKNGLADPLQIINGQAVGVSFTKKGSDPNIFNSAIIRGTSSEYSSGTLFIIDGIYGANPELLIPSDIESFVILKDAAITAMYGSQGSAGVIIIKTKSYKGDKKISINFNSFLSINTPSKKLDLLSASDYRSFITKNSISGFIDGGSSTDWQDEIFRTTVSQTYNIAISGKLDKTCYQVSIFHQNSPGIVIGSDRKNMGLNLHLNQTVLNDRLNLRGSTSVTNPTSNFLPSDTGTSIERDNVFSQAFKRNPTDPIFNADGTYNQILRDFNYYNPLAIIKYTTNTGSSKNVNLNFGANYKIIKGLNFDLNIGYILSNYNTKYIQKPEALSGFYDEVSTSSTNDSKSLNLETGLIYSKSFGLNHHLNIQFGYSNRKIEEEYNSHYVTTGYDDTNYSKTNRDYNTLIGKFDYNFKQRYFLSTLVNNEYTKFGMKGTNLSQSSPVKRISFFPAITIGWKIDNEPFLNQLNFINDLTLKVGYGITGNAKADFLVFSSPLIGTDSLKMEKTKEVSFGFNFGLWENRVSGSFTYYERNTKNAITYIPLPVPPYPYNHTYGNGTWYRNKGFELTLKIIPIATNYIKWSASLTYFMNSNELVSSKSMLTSNTQTGYFTYSSINQSTQLLQTGNPSTVFYLPVSAGHSSTGAPLFYSENGSLTSNINLAKKEIMSQPIPKFEIGWANNLQFSHGFNLSFALRYVGGNSIYNATRMSLSNRSILPILNVSQEGVGNYNKGYSSAPLSDLYLEDASYLRLENVTLSYTIKPKNIKWGDSMNIYLSANNLLTITKFTGFDPSGYSDGINHFNVYPLARSFVFGIRLTL